MIKGIGHLALTVLDMEKSLHFYCDILGLKRAFELKDSNGNPWIINVKIAEGQYLELMYGGVNRYEYVEENAGLSHICLEVDDIFETAETLRKNGIVLDIEPKKGSDLNYQCWACDPDGHRIEFMQFDPNSPQKSGKW
jgi:catechol 2,3-dioxygenase-like lactoylglutathione lyase family enzyme